MAVTVMLVADVPRANTRDTVCFAVAAVGRVHHNCSALSPQPSPSRSVERRAVHRKNSCVGI